MTCTECGYPIDEAVGACLYCGAILPPPTTHRTIVTDLRRSHGLETAREAVGHVNLQTSARYDRTGGELARAAVLSRDPGTR